ncbi:glycosyl hydrolase-related protein [Williamsoniiplasma luminosum]|uniref:Glycoside hydrolase family 38 central domain-containing protein n=1 Tax=Williamsoniiplasma luminosum TaxID=214888 RepID=A0A2S0NJ06_9MOLU|nr:glycosyl hydrolase-related protein [Williamsoniiplasma luminosum]AVP48992.1 MAG: hypothetical protein C5T88_00085 [Williamsoniiplasma luminosum]
MKKWKIHFVPHTHWDKEWYFTKDASNVFLVDNIHKIKSIYKEKDSFSHQVYDSQLSIIDDYLSLFPEDEKLINQLIKDKKIIVGPWYTQPDLFSTSGESLLRNLSYGKHFAQKRGFSAKQAYTPDSFGFNSNLPQIIKHNDCDAIIQWRGVDQNHINESPFNIWTGVDGTEVYLYNLFKYGYGLAFWAFNSIYKKWDKKNIKDLAKTYLENFQNNNKEHLNVLKDANKNTGNILCFPFGSDQSPIIQWLPLFIKELNLIDLEHEWILSDFDAAINDMIDATKNQKINKISGELKYGQFSRAHRTIGSSRFDIKSLNKEAEYLLYNVAEPLGLIYKKFTGQYSERIYQTALKLLLESQAHDSLGGSCTDQVNDEVRFRLQRAIDMIKSQNTLIKRRITEYLGLENNDLIIFNLMPYKRDIDSRFSIVSFSKEFSLFYNNEKIDFSIVKSDYYDRDNFVIEEDSHLSNQISEKGFYITEIELKMKDIEGLFYKIIQVQETPIIKHESQECLITKTDKMVNEYFDLEWNKNLLIKDLQTNHQFELEFEFDQDAGDTYDYSPTMKETKYKVKQTLKIIKQNSGSLQILDILAKIDLPESLQNPKLIEQEIRIKSLLRGKNLDFNVELNNKVCDIRLRAILIPDFISSLSYADQSLALVERDIYEYERMKIWQKDNWKDMPVAIENFYSFVYSKSSEGYKLGFYSKTQNEYEFINVGNQQKIAITLFRGVSLMGRRNLIYRPGRASGINDFPYHTDNSNLKKKLNFNFSIMNDYFNPNEIQIKFTGMDYFQNQRISDYFSIGQTFWKAIIKSKNKVIKPDNLFETTNECLIITAIKKRYDANDIICRIANVSKQKIDISSMVNTIDYEVYETNALEKKQETFEPLCSENQIKTLIFKRKNN